MTVPRFCYVVMCHTRPDAVARLVRRIRSSSPSSDVLVRYGAESGLDPAPLREAGARTFASPLRTAWGEWSLVEAEMEAYAHAVRELDPDYVVLVSGQDHPVRDLAAWEREVAASGTDGWLLDLDPHPVTTDYHWRIVTGPRLPAPVRRAAVAVAWRLTQGARGLLQVGEAPREGDPRWWVGVRRGGGRRTVRKASQWKALSRRAVDTLLDRWEHDRDERAYLAACKCPDELYAPTVLRSVEGLSFEDRPVTHATFPTAGSSPEWVSEHHVDAARASGAAFVRKVHPDAPERLLHALDAAASR